MYALLHGELIYECMQCECGSLDVCWNCGSTDLVAHLVALYPGQLVEEILDA